MSHIPQRKERDCLNCGTIVEGRFCQNCGQENVVPRETFWHMVTHFFYDIVHFDSKFFHTLQYLIFKPGFLTKEYMKGRRVAYLHPIKMYVFTSAVFFLLFFTFFTPDTVIKDDFDKPVTGEARKEVAERLKTKYQKDSSNITLKAVVELAFDTSRVLRMKDYVEFDEEEIVVNFGEKNYYSIRQYDSLQKLLPKSERDGWIERRVVVAQINLNNAYKQDPAGTTKRIANGLLHRLPYMLFISLPLFALILKLVYVRRKQFFYADHGVFTIHLYIFTFILLLLFFISGSALDKTGWDIFYVVNFLLFLLLFFYLYKAMRNFYGQKRGKTFIKFSLVAILSLVMMLVLFLVFFIFSVFTI